MQSHYKDFSFLRSLATVIAVFTGAFVASVAVAQNDRRLSGFDVEFSNCIESIGVGLLPTDKVRLLVPTEFILAGEGAPVTPTSFGRLAEFFVLDTRQYRTDQPSGDGLKPLSEEAWKHSNMLLGKQQRGWLDRGLIDSTAT